MNIPWNPDIAFRTVLLTCAFITAYASSHGELKHLTHAAMFLYMYWINTYISTPIGSIFYDPIKQQ